MRAYELSKHQNCTDLAFYIKKVQWRGPDYIKIRGWFVNVANPGHSYIIDPQGETIKILRADLPKWHVIPDAVIQ